MPEQKPSFVKAVLGTGLFAGITDGLAAIGVYLWKGGKDPGVVFKFIASGVFGKDAFSGGASMIAWGVIFHLLIATGFTFLFFLMYRRWKWLSVSPALSGMGYGIVVWLIMNQIVVPLSKVAQRTPTVESVITGIVVLMLFLGLPIALLAAKYFR